MKLPRRTFLRLAAAAAALPAVSRIAWAQTYPTRIVIRIFPQFAQRLGRVEGANFAEFDTSSSRFVPRACTHKSAPCKRGSVTVRFAPKATELLRCRKTSLCADSWNAAKLFARDHLRKNRCTTPKAGLESVAEVVDIYQQATRRQR